MYLDESVRDNVGDTHGTYEIDISLRLECGFCFGFSTWSLALGLALWYYVLCVFGFG